MDLTCDVCEKKFPTNASLYSHKVTHQSSIIDPEDNNFDENNEYKKIPEGSLVDNQKLIHHTSLSKHEAQKLTAATKPSLPANIQKIDSYYRKKRHLSKKPNLSNIASSSHSNNKENEIYKLQNKHKKNVERIKKTHSIELRECRVNIKLLNDQIKAMMQDDPELSELKSHIFNSSTIRGIQEIQDLLDRNMIKAISRKHLKVLQMIFLGITCGIIPLCQPQKDNISNAQRNLVYDLPNTSATGAKCLIKQNTSDLISLFFIISDSLKFIREVYYKFQR